MAVRDMRHLGSLLATATEAKTCSLSELVATYLVHMQREELEGNRALARAASDEELVDGGGIFRVAEEIAALLK